MASRTEQRMAAVTTAVESARALVERCGLEDAAFGVRVAVEDAMGDASCGAPRAPFMPVGAADAASLAWTARTLVVAAADGVGCADPDAVLELERIAAELFRVAVEIGRRAAGAGG